MAIVLDFVRASTDKMSYQRHASSSEVECVDGEEVTWYQRLILLEHGNVTDWTLIRSEQGAEWYQICRSMMLMGEGGTVVVVVEEEERSTVSSEVKIARAECAG